MRAVARLDPQRLVGNPGVHAYTGPVLGVDQTSTIGGPVGRSVTGGFGGVTPIQAHSARIPADLYGLHQEELARQPVPTLNAGAIPRAD
jgi:hypothetical protein